MDKSECSVGVEYISIFHPNIPPLVLGMLIQCVAMLPQQLKWVWILVETRLNKDGYFVVLTYRS